MEVYMNTANKHEKLAQEICDPVHTCKYHAGTGNTICRKRFYLATEVLQDSAALAKTPEVRP